MADCEFPIVGSPYFVSSANATDLEPRSGWYFSVEHEDGEDFLGPFNTRLQAQEVADDIQEEAKR